MTQATTDAPPVTTPVPLLDLKLQYATIRDEVMAAIEAICESQRFIGGPEVVACEEAVAAYSGCKVGVGMSSGTDALLCGMMAMGIGPGDEVIVPSFTFFATAGCVSRLGAKPVFVDIDAATFNTTAEQIERAITPKTKLIIPVHLYGQCADMTGILKVANQRGIPVMEDAAQSIGAKHHGKAACSMGKLGTLSFFPSKNLGAFGDAGMIVTNDSAFGERCRMFRDHGAQPKYYHKWVGGNFRLDALQAAVVRIKLKHLDAWSARRMDNAKRYNALFAGSVVKTPVIAPGNDSIYNQYVIRVPKRDELKKHLDGQGIGTEVYYPVPLHMQECFAYLGGKAGDLPICEQAAREVLAIPIYPELTAAQQERVARTIRAFYGERA
jgi:dTDP-4-amino-4,6-dideoxygalactose transaminase